MRSFLRTLMLATFVAGFVTTASAVETAGYVNIHGINGPSDDNHHLGWADLAHHDIEIDEDGTCNVVVDANFKYTAPELMLRVGTTISEVKIELWSTGKFGERYYRAIMEDVRVKKVVTSSGWGRQYEQVVMEPASINLDVKKQRPDGTLESGGSSHVDCGPHR